MQFDVINNHGSIDPYTSNIQIYRNIQHIQTYGEYTW